MIFIYSYSYLEPAASGGFVSGYHKKFHKMAAVVSLINDREFKKKSRRNVDNFLRFESEAQETVSSLYKKHQSGTKPAEAFLLSRAQMNTLVEPAITDWIKNDFQATFPSNAPSQSLDQRVPT